MSARPWWRGIRVNPGFVLLAVIYVMVGQGRLFAMGFLAVTLHEIAHAVVAEGYGITVERLEIWPFGGVARMTGLSSQDRYIESMVAVVGPLQNFLLAAAAWVVGPYFPWNLSWVHEFVAMNLAIGAINLLPAAPLDGGRLARLYWTEKMGYERAEQRVSAIGKGIALALFVITIGSFVAGTPLLTVGMFAGFLYWGGHQSRSHAPFWIMRDLHTRSSRFYARPVWAVDDFAVRADASIGQVLKVMRPMRYHRVVVLDHELALLGTLYEEDLIRGLQQEGPSMMVGKLLR